MKWSGVQDGKFSPNFVHATTEETNRIKQVLVFSPRSQSPDWECR